MVGTDRIGFFGAILYCTVMWCGVRGVVLHCGGAPVISNVVTVCESLSRGGGVCARVRPPVFCRYETLRRINPAHHVYCQKDVAVIHWCVCSCVGGSSLRDFGGGTGRAQRWRWMLTPC